MNQTSIVQLMDRRTGRLVDATLIDGLNEADVETASNQWEPYLNEQLARMQADGVPREKWPQHRHWNWREKHDAYKALLACRMFGIECDSQIQGLMLVLTAGNACRIESQKGKPLVYVHFLAAAPWNLPSIAPEPRYSLVGSVLIAVAIVLSMEEEFSGRIGLHSLPQADDWYANSCGMTDLGTDPAVQNLRYFEMTPEQASEFIQ